MLPVERPLIRGPRCRRDPAPPAAREDIPIGPNEEGTIMKLDELLSSRQIAFERLPHRPTYTADRMAQTLHVRGREVAFE